MVAINFPDSPTNGQEHSGYVWDAANNVWNRLPTLPALDLVNFSAVAPSNPQDGQFWFDTTAGKMYVYYNDGSSAQWVSTLGGLVGQTGTEGQILVHNGTEWLPSDGISHNTIINGDFGVNQRGFSSTTSSGEYLFDRFRNNFSGGTSTYSAQSFTPADLEVLGYGDATSFLRIANSSYTGASAYCLLQQYVEDVRTLSGQSATLSFWAKSGSSSSITIELEQYFGSGGSTSVNNIGSVKIATTTSWARYSATITVPSISGKTLGANSSLRLNMWFEAGTDFNTRSNSLGLQNDTFDVWGVQLETGSVATPFRLAGGGSKAAELALCQRYYQVISSGSTAICSASAYNTTHAYGIVSFMTEMRVAPSLVQAVGADLYQFYRSGNADTFDSFSSTSGASPRRIRLNALSGLSHSAGVAGWFESAQSSSLIAFDAEL